MKLVGIVMIVLCCTAGGIIFTQKLSERVSCLQQSRLMLTEVMNLIRYAHPMTQDILEELEKREGLSKLDFLGLCRRLMEDEAFPTAWEQAVHSSRSALSIADRAILQQLSGVIGSADADSQLNSLSHYGRLLDDALEKAQETNDTHGKLYLSLGLLSGLFVAVLVV